MQGFKEKNPDLTVNKSFEIYIKACHLFTFQFLNPVPLINKVNYRKIKIIVDKNNSQDEDK